MGRANDGGRLALSETWQYEACPHKQSVIRSPYREQQQWESVEP